MLIKKLIPLVLLLFCFLNGGELQAQKQQKDLQIVFIGNSITRGSGLANREAEAAPVHTVAYLQKQKRVGKVQYSNQGVGGYTTVHFLPATNKAFPNITKAADEFSTEATGILVFSIMLGTNDSAIEGPLGAPVAAAQYGANLKIIADTLLSRYPNSVLVFHRPLWYSPNTQNNGAAYLAEGLNRLQTYYPQLNALVAAYASTHPGRVFLGDKKGHKFFRKHHLKYFQHEKGKQGIFYLHPNQAGAEVLGKYWGKAIRKAVCLSR